MGVRAEIRRQIPLDVSRVQVQILERAKEDGSLEARGISHEIERPYPGNGAKRQFETTGPIDSDLRRIVIHPRGNVVRDERCITIVIREQVRATECHKVLMAIQLPCELAIAGHERVEVCYSAPVYRRRAFTRERLQSPIRT